MAETGRHTLSIEDRRRLVADGVRQVGTFTEKEIQAQTTLGCLVLKGEGLQITELNLETGRLVIEGSFRSITYVEEERRSGRGVTLHGIWGRLVR
uniref:Sporulation protein YabP n=1 Tax=Ammonifex degensii TaxID=42838 RepID=A0A7C1J4T9_9THEO